MCPASSNMCWRCKREAMIHIWWACPTLAPLWTQALRIMLDMLGHQAEKNPALCLLYMFPERMSKTHRALIYHTLTSIHILMARHWKAREISSHTHLVNQIALNWTYEAMHQHQFGPRPTVAKAKHIWDTYNNHTDNPTT
ncbi:Hypothetical predicted protein [Pelobates cultripes]|uniref:Uncharacterized protein n=1 Tax=Pelobates cultripes TaxID=61616 RepID=A0AAD1S7C5_PELCU|nr:Hypothetical predicted protein [Pelobates cultripes]